VSELLDDAARYLRWDVRPTGSAARGSDERGARFPPAPEGTLGAMFEGASSEMPFEEPGFEAAPAASPQLLIFAREIKEIYRQERARTRELERALDQLNDAYVSTMKTLAFLVEAKDVGTRMHLERTSHYGMALARAMEPELLHQPDLGYGFLLHDIGKIGISDRILMKRGPLSPAEWAVMKTHPVIGAQVVAPMSFLDGAVEVIRAHHERWDGGGYPSGLRGTQIPLAARIFSVVDAFDAMTSDRPYRKAMPVEGALGEIASGTGTQFDPDVVDAFLDLMDGSSSPARPATAG
jgi:HD-GYP domain-containing protein (c-di-GMP phosphodiesterase class II)